MMGKLTDREEQFVLEYCLDWNVRRAALAAGYPTASHGARVLRKRAVQELVQKEKEERRDRLRVDPDRLTEEWARISFANARKYFPKAGEAVDLTKLNEDETAAVSEFFVDEQVDERTGTSFRRTRVKLHDKLGALNSLARSIGMLKEEHAYTIEHRISLMTSEERQDMARELLERGRRYLADYERAMAEGKAIEHEPAVVDVAAASGEDGSG